MRHNTVSIGLLTALCLLMLGPIAAQQPPRNPAIDVETLGPQVGATVPDFSLPDQHGVTRSLKSLIGPKGAILVFFRSADW
jgi:cytochrome oxidase Cu insertion factor (SCO1/SenC/PrrC family)